MSPITLAEFRKLPNSERDPYTEGVWRKCDQCNPYAPTADCHLCCGNGVFLQMQLSAQVIDAKYRVETDVPEGWRMGDPL